MPSSIYEAAMRDPGFLITVASVYESQNKLEIAQDILEKSVAQQTAAGKTPSAAVSLALAGIYLSRNDPQRALPIYRGVLLENSDRPNAWKGLLSALHTSGHDREALAQVQQIPPPLRQQLENDVEYLQTVGAIYNSLGQPREAMVFMQAASNSTTPQAHCGTCRNRHTGRVAALKSRQRCGPLSPTDAAWRPRGQLKTNSAAPFK